MFLLDDTVVTSASDLTTASKCEFAFLRALDVKLGRIPALEEAPDAMYERTSRLGDEHEHRVLELYRDQYGAGSHGGIGVVREAQPGAHHAAGGGVAEIDRPESMTVEGIQAVVADTLEAFRRGATVVFQATFFTPSVINLHERGSRTSRQVRRIGFIGFADFIVRQTDGSYLVQDTKLARSARVTALLQLAAYAEELEGIGVEVAPTVELLLGDGSVSEHRLSDILPVYRKRRARLLQIVAERVADPLDAAVEWGDPRYTVCGHCDACEAEIQSHRDVLLVAGMRVGQRARLLAAGIDTIESLAASTGAVEGISDAAVDAMRQQARLQLDAVDGSPPPVALYDPSALAVLPDPDPGDIFFDFEGDPLYTEGSAPDGGLTQWGLDYLFGLIEADGTFRAFWAHDFAEERAALRVFLDYLGERRRRHPGMHVYHYAAYERTHLLGLAARHGIGEDEIDQLLRENALVDLYPLVKKSVRVGSRSYSIKKLEPLYMGTEIRLSDVTNAADSITEYARARELDATGEHLEGQRMLDSIADYNHYDCLSTLRLRDWLLERARESGIQVGRDNQESGPDDLEPSPLRDALLALAGDQPPSSTADLTRQRTPDQTAAAFAAAAIDYHRREQKSFWWEHFARLIQPVEEWQDVRDVFIVEHAEIEHDWFREGRQQRDRRMLRLTGALAPGSSIQPGVQAGPFLLYEHPGPFAPTRAEPGARPAKQVRVVEVGDDGSILIEELLPLETEPYATSPIALAPSPPPNAGQQKPAIDEWAQSIVDAQPDWPSDPVSDLLRRIPPRARSGGLARAATTEATGDAIVESVLDLEDSYLAVQGPPGTGKTYLGARAIARLVQEHAWKVGVVGQSHPVVENLLDAVVAAGLDRSRVGKVPKAGSDASHARFTALPPNGQLIFAAEHAHEGYVIGGTAWDFSNPARVPRRALDLLVIDEAGQFSLASTIAASVGARNLLLLGDPQQLPQVSQGTHPEPIDQSALGWIAGGHEVLPPELGYFLAESRRMHPALTKPVSRLSYEGKLHSHPDAAARSLASITPGLHVMPVTHADNATSSPEEASTVVDVVRDVLGTAWTDPGTGRRDDPLTQDDVIVVTPYNAQLALVHDALAEAGFPDIRVGTVDKFQGQEAVVAIVTLAASSAADVPRGMSFLIMKNRLNVAISRAQWAAYLIYSPDLTEYLPTRPDGVAELSAFLTLVEP